MKKTIITGLIALLPLASSLHAAEGDEILIFEGNNSKMSSGYQTEFAINLGSAAAFPQNTIDLNTVLTSTYGSDWYTSGNVSWGAIGVIGSTAVMIDSTGLNHSVDTRFNTALGSVISNFNGAISASSTYGGATTGTVGDLSYYKLASANNIGTTFLAQDLNGWGNALTGSIFTVLHDNDTININQFAQSGPSTTIGSFTASGGTINAVPEPSTYALLGFGALLLVVAYRRRTA